MKNQYPLLLSSSVLLAAVLVHFSFVSAHAQDTLANPPASSDPLLQEFLGTSPTADFEDNTMISSVQGENQTGSVRQTIGSQTSEIPSNPTAGTIVNTMIPESLKSSESVLATVSDHDVQKTEEINSYFLPPALSDHLQKIIDLQKKEPAFDTLNSIRIKYITGDAKHEGRSGDDTRRGNFYSMPSYKVKDSLTGVGIDVDLCLFDNVLLTASYFGSSGTIQSGSVYRDSEWRWYFEDSDMKFSDGKLGLRYNLAPRKLFNPFAEIGGEFFRYEIHYAYTMTWWYWLKSGNVANTKKHNTPGKYKGDDMTPYAKLGIEMNYERLLIRLGIDYSFGLESAWDGDDDDSFTMFLNATIRLWDKLLLGVEIAEIPAGEISYVGFLLGWTF